jgi:hypothetical protein
LIENPEVQAELELTNRRVDPIEEAFDLVVRVGVIEDSTMVARTIYDVPFGLFASTATAQFCHRRMKGRGNERYYFSTLAWKKAFR